METTTRARIDSIDLLRGVVIVLMALDHARDFLGPTPYPPEDLDRTSIALFLTRWITHFCAPAFVFLAGTAAALWAAKGRPRREVTRFLITRGLWLIVVEIAVVNPSWLQFYYSGALFIQVIWVLGWSMITLAGLLYVPRAALIGIGLAMCLGHNLLDPIQARSFGDLAVLWGILHEPYWQPLSDRLGVFIAYPLIPWLGVMALGYAFGSLFRLDRGRRDRIMLVIGLTCTVAFVVLRFFNLYGEPNAWAHQERGAAFSFLSFLNTQKYPPSLHYLLMTLGPVIALLPALDRARGPVARFFITFGRVPMFFYLVHIPILHLCGLVWLSTRYGTWIAWYGSRSLRPAAYESSLIEVYVGWILVTLGLYFLCRWYMGVKRRRTEWWLRYL